MEDGIVVIGKLNEEFLISSFYANAKVYGSLGKEMGICLFAIDEGFYSVVKIHKQSGGQDSDNLLRRSIVDWSLPHPVSCSKTMQHIAELYVEGNKDVGIPKQRPFFFMKR